MANGIIQVPPDSTGKKVDAASLDVGADSVIRQRIVIGDNSATAGFATVTLGALMVTGTVNISAMPTVTLPANIGTVNNISATVVVAGTVNISATVLGVVSVSNNLNISALPALVAGTANIGFIDHISRTVQVAIATPLVLDAGTANIGGVSLVAGTSNIGFINNISATVTVAGNVTIANNVTIASLPALAAGTANIGSINNISATVTVAGNIGLGYILEKTTNSQVLPGDSLNAAVRVNVVAGAAGGVSQTDNTSYSATSAFVPVGGVFDDAAPSTLTEGNAGAARVTTNRALHANLRTDGGVKMDDSTNSSLRVTIVSGAGSGGTASPDRAAFTESTTNLTPAGGVYSEVRNVVAEDTVAALRINAQAGLHVNLRTSDGNEVSAGNALSVKVEQISANVNVVIQAGGNNIGTVNNISATVTAVLGAGTNNIGGVSLVAGTANIGFINNISATVTVTGAVGIGYVREKTTNSQVLPGDSLNAAIRVNLVAADFTATTVLAAGASNIGSINNISATVAVVIATPFTVNNISASVIIATGATADFNTLASADQVQTLPLLGIALPASGGAVAGGTITNPVVVAGTINISAMPTVTVNSHAVSLVAGTANIGFINNISATVTVAGSVAIVAGAANIGSINNISATVTVAGNVNISTMPAVALAAGTANIGFLNHISATVAVAISTPFTVNNISATVAVTMATTASFILASVKDVASGLQVVVGDSANTALRVNVVAGVTLNTLAAIINNINISTMPTVVISGTVTVASANPYVLNIPSASHGPKCVTASTSANVTLVAAPGAGLSVYITSLAVTNASTSNFRARVGPSASGTTVQMYLGSAGGGFVWNFDPPWKIISNEAVVCSVKPNAADGFFNINFYVAA